MNLHAFTKGFIISAFASLSLIMAIVLYLGLRNQYELDMISTLNALRSSGFVAYLTETIAKFLFMR